MTTEDLVTKHLKALKASLVASREECSPDRADALDLLIEKAEKKIQEIQNN